MSDAYVGEIRIFAGNYAPRSWLLCQGQLLSIAQNAALYTVIGTAFGGDGVNTFALPHFGGRMPVGTGTLASSGRTFNVGQTAGNEFVTVLNSNMPVHTHALGASTKPGVTNKPGPNTNLAVALDAAGTPINIYGEVDNPATPVNTVLAPQVVSSTGGSIPISVRNPYMTLSFIICIEGIFPPHQ